MSVHVRELRRLQVRARVAANPLWVAPLLFGAGVAATLVGSVSALAPSLLLIGFELVVVVMYLLQRRAVVAFGAPPVRLIDWAVIATTVAAAYVVPRLAAAADLWLINWTGSVVVIAACLSYFGWGSRSWAVRLAPVVMAVGAFAAYGLGSYWALQLVLIGGLVAFAVLNRRALVRG